MPVKAAVIWGGLALPVLLYKIKEKTTSNDTQNTCTDTIQRVILEGRNFKILAIGRF